MGSTRSDICGTRTCFRRRVRTGARWAAKGWKWFPYLEGVRQLAWSTGLVGVWNNGYDREQHSDDKTRKPEKRQNRPQTEIAHRLSRAPTGGNITVAKCTNTVSFLSLPCLMLLENKNCWGLGGKSWPGRPRRWMDQGESCGTGMIVFLLFSSSIRCFHVLVRVVWKRHPTSRKGGGLRDEGAFCDVVPVHRFVLCTFVPVLGQPLVYL